MSGIGCVWCFDGAPADEPLGRLAAAQRHRGSHGEDAWVDGSIGLVHAHTWTTFEDAGERQPIEGGGGRFRIVADARIDNRDDLIPQLAPLIGSGAPTDARVIVAAYEKWGDECADRLVGNFAFVIWDARLRRLFAARDPFGLRMLYYHEAPTRIVLASTLIGIRRAAPASSAINRPLLRDYLKDDFRRWTHETAYEGMFRLPPAHHATIEAGRLTLRRYYVLGGLAPPRLNREADYIDRYRELFAQSIRAHMRAAGPIGILLSGGLDSSSMACQSEQLVTMGATPGPVRTYSAVYPTMPRADESAEIRALLDSCPHLTGRLIPCDDLWPLQEFRIDDGYVAEEPAVGRNPTLMLRCLRAAKEDGCVAVLSGAGADQLVSGAAYGNPRLLRDLSFRQARAELHHFTRRQSALRVIASAYVRPALKAIRNAARPRRGGYLERPALASVAAQEAYMELTGGAALARRVQHDRTAARVGIEWRLPFLDRRLVDFMMGVPAGLRFRNGEKKYIVRRALAGLVPPNLADSRTSPGLNDLMVLAAERETAMAGRLLTGSRLVDLGLLSPDVAARLPGEFRAQPTVARFRRLHRILAAEAWLRAPSSAT